MKKKKPKLLLNIINNNNILHNIIFKSKLINKINIYITKIIPKKKNCTYEIININKHTLYIKTKQKKYKHFLIKKKKKIIKKIKKIKIKYLKIYIK